MLKTIWGILYGPYGVRLFRSGSFSFLKTLLCNLTMVERSVFPCFAGFCTLQLYFVGVRVGFVLAVVGFALLAASFFRELWNPAASSFWLPGDEHRTAPFFRAL